MAAGGPVHRTAAARQTEAPPIGSGPVPVGRCESCGDVDVEVERVRRVYLTPESWDTQQRVEPAGLEMWCFVCRTHYPHAEPDDDFGTDSQD